MGDEIHINKLKEGVQSWNLWRRENPNIQPDLSGSDFSELKLDFVNFRNSNLQGINLQGTNLYKANLCFAKLCEANLKQSSLIKSDPREADLSNANLAEANLSRSTPIRANFNHANLQRANLRDADLVEANLSEADISDAILVGTQALKTIFTGATLTGACIADWNINSDTKLEGIQCRYIYLRLEKSCQKVWYGPYEKYRFCERRPSSGYFVQNEFAALFQKALDTIDLIFLDGIDWTAFLQSFQELRTQYGQEELAIQAIEKKNFDTFIVRLQAPLEADKALIESQVKALYERKCEILEAQYRVELKAKDTEITIHRRQSADLMEIIKLQATRQISIEAKAMAASQSDSNTFNNDLREARISNFANQVQDNARQQANQHNYASPEKQTLAEAATEIQRLLKQLEETNPTATEIEQVAYVDVAAKPDLKQRAIAALRAGGDTAIDEFFLENKYLKVGKAVVRAWLQPNS